MLADIPWCPLKERAAALGAARRRAEQETGQPKIYLANITDEVDRLVELHDLAVAAGANALLVNAMPVGLSGVRMLRRHAEVPLIAHFPFIAAFSRLCRLRRPFAGVHPAAAPRRLRRRHHARLRPAHDDAGSRGAGLRRACLEPMGPIKPCLPVPGGSDSAATLEGVYRKLGSADFGFVPGRGVFGHPMGPRGGAATIRQAWEAIAGGIPLDRPRRDASRTCGGAGDLRRSAHAAPRRVEHSAQKWIPVLRKRMRRLKRIERRRPDVACGRSCRDGATIAGDA